jgi:hypothetical protein
MLNRQTKILVHNTVLCVQHKAFHWLQPVAQLFVDGDLRRTYIQVATSPIGECSMSHPDWERVADDEAEYRVRRRIDEIFEAGDRLVEEFVARQAVWDSILAKHVTPEPEAPDTVQ